MCRLHIMVDFLYNLALLLCFIYLLFLTFTFIIIISMCLLLTFLLIILLCQNNSNLHGENVDNKQAVQHKEHQIHFVINYIIISK